MNPIDSTLTPVVDLGVDERSRFVSRTYGHLLGAVAAFTGLEAILFASGLAETIAQTLLGTSWLVVLGGFIIGTVLALVGYFSMQAFWRWHVVQRYRKRQASR